jgi:hypothetical protein
MAVRLCKLSRSEIISSLGEIESLVRQPQFICRSCARSAQQANRLCKPTALTPIATKALSGENSASTMVVLGKKARKRQKKANKKLKKIIKKQTKLLKKAGKLNRRFADYQSLLPVTDSQRSLINIH